MSTSIVCSTCGFLTSSDRLFCPQCHAILPDYRKNSTQLRQLCDALIDTFPTHQDLEMMVADELNEDLSTIAGDGSLRHTIFNLVQWALAKRRLEELVRAALDHNRQNSQLRYLARQLSMGATPEALSSPQRVMPSSSSQPLELPSFSSQLPLPLELPSLGSSLSTHLGSSSLRGRVNITKLVWVVSSVLLAVGVVIYLLSSSSLNPFAPKDVGSPDLHLVPKYAGQMQVGNPYIVRVVLSSSKGNIPLSAVKGSVVGGESMPLRTLLGQQNTPCAAASLIVDQTAFRVQPSQPQEYSLEQSQITWTWSVTPLRGDLQKPQEIPVHILFSGKSHCGSGDALTGPYPFAGNSFLTIAVESYTPPPVPEPRVSGPPFGVWILLGVPFLLFLAYLALLSVSLRRKRRHPVKKPETESTRVDLVNKPLVDELAQTKRLQQARAALTSLSIFYCYASQDKALRTLLETHLSPLHRSGQIINWHDGEIVPGTPWDEETMTRLNAAHIILLLISPDFVASDRCYCKEMVRAIERHQAGEVSVVPIILRPVVWDRTPFAHLQVLPSGGKPVSSWPTTDAAFYDVVQGLRSVVATLLTHS